MRLSIIVAVARDGAIGKGNDLLWHLSSDLKRFRTLTTGHSIIMGRRTYESLPNGALPNRRNIVVSRSLGAVADCEVCPSLESALRLTENEDEVFVIGGGEVYQQSLALATDLHITIVEAEYPEADTHFPTIDWSEWSLQNEESVPIDERNPLASTYYHYIRKN